MTFLRGQTFPNAGQWPFYVKQHLVDQNFPTTKHLRHFSKENCNRTRQVSCFVFAQSLRAAISVLFAGGVG